MKAAWARIERLLDLARLQREHITRMGEGCNSWISIAEHAAEIELEARGLACATGCTTHQVIAP